MAPGGPASGRPLWLPGLSGVCTRAPDAVPNGQSRAEAGGFGVAGGARGHPTGRPAATGTAATGFAGCCDEDVAAFSLSLDREGGTV